MSIVTHVTSFVGDAVTIVIGVVAAGFWMGAWGITESPLTIGTNFLTHPTFSRALPACPIGTSLALFIGVLVAVVVFSVATDFCCWRRARSPHTASADLRPTTHAGTGSLLTFGTLISKALAVHTPTVVTVRIHATAILSHLTLPVHQYLPVRTGAPVRKKQDTPLLDASMIGRALARKGTLLTVFALPTCAAQEPEQTNHA